MGKKNKKAGKKKGQRGLDIIKELREERRRLWREKIAVEVAEKIKGIKR